ncbi:MAG: O-antigen ligase family protein [Lachnospiraceae bacterium]|nr:O-antigen ligase family protein [Lachnospiraceae bacterium]
MEGKVKLEKAILQIYLISTFCLFAFFAYEGDGSALYGRTVPYINMEPIIPHFVILVGCFAIFLLCKFSYKEKIKVDMICGCLLIKGCLDLIPFAQGVTPKFNYFFQYYVITWLALLSYLILINVRLSKREIEFVQKELAVFGIVLSVQVVYTALNCGVSYSNDWYKTYMVIPYAGSNVIAALLVPIVFITFFGFKKCLLRNLVVAFIGIAIVLTRSRGALLLSAALIFFFAYRKGDKRAKQNLRRVALCIILILMVPVALSSQPAKDLLFNAQSTMYDTALERMLNGRLNLWRDTFKANLSFETFFFGTGMYPPTSESSNAGLHNILLDLFLRCGFMGTLNYSAMFLLLIRRGKRVFQRKNCAFFIGVCIIYINSLFEVCFFSYKPEAFLWIFIGVMMSEYYSDRKDILMNSQG